MIRDRKRSTYLRCVKAGRRCNFFLNGSLSQESSERTVPIRDFLGRASINAGVEDRCLATQSGPVVESNNNRLRVGSTHPYLAADSGNRAAPPIRLFFSPSREQNTKGTKAC